MPILGGFKSRLKRRLWNHGFEIRNHRARRTRERDARLKAMQLVEGKQPISLEIGSGRVKGTNGWVTLDMSEGADITWDLARPLPFPDQSVSMIYSSHVLEHFQYRDLCRLLSDCLRVLIPGGLFSVCVPDASIYVRGYFDPSVFTNRFFGYKPAIVSDLKMDRLNFIAYMDGEHKFMFDTENLLALLERVGFSDVGVRGFDPLLDKPERSHESIYALARKSV